MAKSLVVDFDHTRTVSKHSRFVCVITPRPGIAKPCLWQDMYGCLLRTAVVNRDSDEKIIGGRLCVFDKHVEIPVVIEDPSVDEVVFRLGPVAFPVFVDKFLIG